MKKFTYWKSNAFRTLNHWQSNKKAGNNIYAWYTNHNNIVIEGLADENGNIYLFPFSWYEEGYNNNIVSNSYNCRMLTGNYNLANLTTPVWSRHFITGTSSKKDVYIGFYDIGKVWTIPQTANLYNDSNANWNFTIPYGITRHSGSDIILDAIDKNFEWSNEYVGGVISIQLHKYICIYERIDNDAIEPLNIFKDYPVEQFTYSIDNLNEALTHGTAKELLFLNEVPRFNGVSPVIFQIPYNNFQYNYTVPSMTYGAAIYGNDRFQTITELADNINLAGSYSQRFFTGTSPDGMQLRRLARDAEKIPWTCVCTGGTSYYALGYATTVNNTDFLSGSNVQFFYQAQTPIAMFSDFCNRDKNTPDNNGWDTVEELGNFKANTIGVAPIDKICDFKLTDNFQFFKLYGT